jgi:hypothetical protein
MDIIHQNILLVLWQKFLSYIVSQICSYSPNTIPSPHKIEIDLSGLYQ